MIKKDYNTILYDKMKAELDRFIAELKTKTPEQIIELAYELTIKEDLLSIFENTDFTQEEAKALNNQKYPLDSLYQEWLSNDLTYMDQLRETVDDKIKSAVKEMKDKQRESR